METREPKKSQGVPKETRAQNSIAALHSALAERLPQVAWAGLGAELERRGFFEASMTQQIRLMAETAVDWAGVAYDKAAVIEALAASPAEKVRGVAAFVVPIVYADDLRGQLQGLYFTGALEGTWPHELSAAGLHNLIIRYGVTTVLARVGDWTQDPNPATRRMVVEAFRPRGIMLPHIDALKQNPAPLKTLLEPLLDDESDYVRKAVANNLNDVSKDNPDAVLAWARAWLTPDASKARRWIITRGLRTLVEEGNPAALQLLNYAPAASLNVVWKDGAPPGIQINQLLPFELDISNPANAEASVIVLLIMDEPGKGDGRRTSKYQLWKGTLKAGETKQISKRVHFIDLTTRRREPGVYRLTVAVNGEPLETRTLTFAR